MEEINQEGAKEAQESLKSNEAIKAEEDEAETLELLTENKTVIADDVAIESSELYKSKAIGKELNNKEIFSALKEQKDLLEKNLRINREIIWSGRFRDTIINSGWFKNQKLSLGGWAIGYPCAYVLYRVLDEIRPKSILELGLGQSTRITSQYSAASENVTHFVIEHDPEWIDFFGRGFKLPENVKIRLCPWDFVSYKDAENVRVFSGFHEALCGEKFELIIVDAPLGGDMKQYSRIDVLKEMPECLAESFVIILDDYNRSGEKKTAEEMKSALDAANIEYAVGVYKGEKDVFVMSSLDNKFVCSM